MDIHAGVGTHGSLHSCYVCKGCKLDPEGNTTTRRGRWQAGELRSLDENQRCYDNWRRDTAGLSKKEAKKKLKDYFNVVNVPFRINSDGEKPIYLIAPFDPLHCVKLGAMSDVINKLQKRHEEVIEKFLDDLSLSRKRGGMPGLNLNG